MKIALVYDWLNTWRGGGSVLAEFWRMYPEATLYAPVDFPGQAENWSVWFDLRIIALTVIRVLRRRHAG